MKNYFMNTDSKYLKNGGRKAPAISIEEFKKIINDMFKREYSKPYYYKPCFYEEEDIIPPDYDAVNSKNIWIPGMLREICDRDLKKVEFDDENIVAYPDDNDGPIKGEELNGLQITSTGIPFYGYYCSGDAGKPIFMIAYWDGKKIRGYIPFAGNTVNKDKTAFCSGCGDGEADKQTIIQLNNGIEPSTYEEYKIIDNVGFDFDWIAKDIECRITVI